jgi:hypothetical protein
METKVTTHIVKGVILGAVYILLSTIIYAFNLYSIQWLSLIIYLFIFAGIIISNIVYANQNNNNESFGNIFADGFKTTSLFIIISIAFTVLFFILLPEMIDITLELQRLELKKKPELTDEMIEDFIAMQKDNFWTFTIAGNIVFNAIIGVIASLIGAAVAKKNPFDPFSNPAS